MKKIFAALILLQGSLCYAGGGTVLSIFNRLEDMYNAGSAAKLSDLDGWLAGRCSVPIGDKIMSGLLASFEAKEEEIDAGPAFPHNDPIRKMTLFVNSKMNFFDEISPDELIAIQNSLGSEDSIIDSTTETDQGLTSIRIEKPMVQKIVVRKNGEYLVSKIISEASYDSEYGQISSGQVLAYCYFYKKVFAGK